ncbi:MAG: hypothetical protein GF333_07960 [Candidatus Omnitrophica bacterium]|nr:hypothetical protein [Candidatus Omnitrophota bacterium]
MHYKKGAQSMVEYICLSIVFATMGIAAFVSANKAASIARGGASSAVFQNAASEDTLARQTLENDLDDSVEQWGSAPAETASYEYLGQNDTTRPADFVQESDQLTEQAEGEETPWLEGEDFWSQERDEEYVDQEQWQEEEWVGYSSDLMYESEEGPHAQE